MRVVLFVHSLLSDWNHGNAHFLRGVFAELQARGHTVVGYEAVNAWSVENLIADYGTRALTATLSAYPRLVINRYDPDTLDLDRAVEGADLVLVHEWNDPQLVRRIGEQRRHRDFVLLFHDTHHRSVSNPREMAQYDLRDYDGVLAFGEAVRERYLRNAWAARVWTWHEAADTRIFRPPSPEVIQTGGNEGGPHSSQLPSSQRDQSEQRRALTWIGNWGDDERTAELDEFLIQPTAQLRLTATAYGVRYPPAAVARLADAGMHYAGWLPNYAVPAAFARHRVTLHVPRRPYVRALPGIPTIRPFEALACGIPLISAPWNDSEGLFRTGVDYLVARNGDEMRRHLRAVLNDPGLAGSLASHGRGTILARHTCAHRVEELLSICATLQPERSQKAPERSQKAMC